MSDDAIVKTVCGEHAQDAYLDEHCAWCRIAQLESALQRIAKGHTNDPPWEQHLYARSCDACNAQEIANAALAPQGLT